MDFADDAEGYANMEDPTSWYNVTGAFFCVLCAALAAGLTVGLMSLDPLELEVKRRVGTPDERKHAEKICPLIAKHHYLLVSLLLFNSIANEALPIFLSGLVPGYVAVLLSVTAILIFGEIIPSALFTGPKQIVMAARFSPFVRFLMGVFWPIAYPIGRILDNWLGDHSFKRYTREELSTLVDLQREVGMNKHRQRQEAAAKGGSGGHGAAGSGHGGHTAREKELGETMRAITMDEATIVAGVLKCHSKKVCDSMRPMDEVYAICEDDKLDENKMCEIMACGFSRIPVHSARGRQDIRGFLLVKRLIILDPEDCRPVRTLPLRAPIVVSPTGSLLGLLNTFQEGRSHMAIVSPCPDLTQQALRSGKPLEGRFAPIGIITLEDLFEEILQEEIFDEHDGRERYVWSVGWMWWVGGVDAVPSFFVKVNAIFFCRFPAPTHPPSPSPSHFPNSYRKAIETLKRVRRKIKALGRQQLELQKQQGGAAAATTAATAGYTSLSITSFPSSDSSPASSVLSGGNLSPATTTSFLLNGLLQNGSTRGAAPATDDPGTSLLSSSNSNSSNNKTNGKGGRKTELSTLGGRSNGNGHGNGNGHPPTSYGSTDASNLPV